MAKHECKVCGYVYDVEEGDRENGVAPGTAFEDIPENWDELTKLPALKRIALPQTALLGQTEFPELPYTVELSGGEGE